jgi:hypothetical protein
VQGPDRAEQTETGTNLRFLETNRKGRSRSIFRFYTQIRTAPSPAAGKTPH